MGDDNNKWLTTQNAHRGAYIALAVLIGLMAFNIDFSVSATPPESQNIVDWDAVHNRVYSLYQTESGDSIADPIDVMVIDAFLTLRDSSVQALKDALPVDTWTGLDDIPGFGEKRLFKVYCLGYDLG